MGWLRGLRPSPRADHALQHGGGDVNRQQSRVLAPFSGDRLWVLEPVLGLGEAPISAASRPYSRPCSVSLSEQQRLTGAHMISSCDGVAHLHASVQLSLAETDNRTCMDGWIDETRSNIHSLPHASVQMQIHARDMSRVIQYLGNYECHVSSLGYSNSKRKFISVPE